MASRIVRQRLTPESYYCSVQSATLDALSFSGHPACARGSMSETAAGVEIRQLHKRFKGGDHDAVDGVDLSIRDGELLVLLGPSGCGKTTLLRMIAGLEHPSAGEIYIAGRRVDQDVPPRAHRRESPLGGRALRDRRVSGPLSASALGR